MFSTLSSVFLLPALSLGGVFGFSHQSLHLALSSIIPFANSKATFSPLIYPLSTCKLGTARHIPPRGPTSRSSFFFHFFNQGEGQIKRAAFLPFPSVICPLVCPHLLRTALIRHTSAEG